MQEMQKGESAEKAEGKELSDTSPTSAGDTLRGFLMKRSGPNMWHRRYCVVEAHQLGCYAQEGSRVPVQLQPLTGCVVTRTHKDKKRYAFKGKFLAYACLQTRTNIASSGYLGDLPGGCPHPFLRD